MLTPRKIREVVTYWTRNGREKRKTMEHLYASKRYADALFFGHLVLECALKALVVQATHDHAPRSHNLRFLAELAGLPLNTKDAQLLEDATAFNMEARYPDDKLVFYKRCTKAYTDRYYRRIRSLHDQLCELVERA